MAADQLRLFLEAPIILDLCSGTGSWSQPYRDAGYDVRMVTLPDDDEVLTIRRKVC